MILASRETQTYEIIEDVAQYEKRDWNFVSE